MKSCFIAAVLGILAVPATAANYLPRVPTGPQASIGCPAGAVTLNPGANIQGSVDAHLAGTTYCLTPGTYMRQQVTPKSGDLFVGQFGAVMDGGGTSGKAFSGTATGVTVKNLVVTNYQPGSQQAMIGGAGIGVDHWTIMNNEIMNAVMTGGGGRCSGCGGLGLSFQNASRIIANKIHHNASMGFSCYGPNDVVTDNEISFNNPGFGTDPGWEAGANKCWLSHGEVFQFNWSHHNNGPGLWFDNGNYSADIQFNTIENNSVGIMWEISGDAEIANNSVGTNQVADGSCQGWMWCADILVSSSGAPSGKLLNIHDNVITTKLVNANGSALSIISQNRPDRFERTCNVHVHHNTVDLSAGGNYGAVEDWGDTGIWTCNNVFNNDLFISPANNFWWNGQSNLSLAVFRSGPGSPEVTLGPGAGTVTPPPPPTSGVTPAQLAAALAAISKLKTDTAVDAAAAQTKVTAAQAAVSTMLTNTTNNAVAVQKALGK